MKVFRVVTEVDGATTKEPGKVSTEIIRNEYHYAANTIEQVWKHATANLTHMEQEIVAIHVQHESVIILDDKP